MGVVTDPGHAAGLGNPNNPVALHPDPFGNMIFVLSAKGGSGLVTSVRGQSLVRREMRKASLGTRARVPRLPASGGPTLSCSAWFGGRKGRGVRLQDPLGGF